MGKSKKNKMHRGQTSSNPAETEQRHNHLDEPEHGIKDKVSIKDNNKISKIKKRRRFGMPGSVVCKGCDSVISEGVKVNAIKEIVGEVCNYKIKCPGCGCKIVLKRTFGYNEYNIIEGAVFDWAGWRKKYSKEYFDRVAPGSSLPNVDVFKMFHIALMVGNPLTEGPYQAI